MNRVMARLKGVTASYRVLFDDYKDADLGFKTPSLDNAKLYDPMYIPESKREWFFVVLDPEQINQMIDPYFDSNNLGSSPIQQAEYASINALYEFHGRRIYFSRVQASGLIGENGKRMISFTDDGIEVSTVSFAVDFIGQVDAYFDGDRKIFFRSYAKAKPLFKGFEIFYQEATRDAKETFLDNDLFAVSEMNPDYISLRDTKRIDSILQNFPLDLEAAETAEAIRKYAANYPLSGVRVDDTGKLIIANKEDLQCVIKLLDQRYFTSELNGDKLEARATSKMKNQKPGVRRD